MKYIKIFEEFGENKYDLDGIKSCFVELEDDNFDIEIEVGYLKFIRHAENVKNGIKITLTKKIQYRWVTDKRSEFTIDNELKDILEVSNDYLQDKYNLKLDYIAAITSTSVQLYFDGKKTFYCFDEIDKDLKTSILYLHFRPVNTFDKVKNYIKNKLK